MAGQEKFSYPFFYDYPPYFTLQPVRDTRERQVQLWKDLILRYCKHSRAFAINLDEDFPLFSNASIQRKLSNEAKELFLGALVAEGRGEWLDKGHRRCLVLWRKVEDWADTILAFAQENALGNGVTTVEELRSGDDSKGTDLEGIDYTVLYRALKVLEHRGKATLFKGSAADDEGVKFFA